MGDLWNIKAPLLQRLQVVDANIPEMITQQRLKEIRGLAESHAGKASGIILELLDDMEKLRALKFRSGLAPVGVLDPWPYHPHLDKTFAEVPEEDLIAWRDSRSRDVLMHDICLGIIAARDLKLYDLITKLATPIPTTPPKEPEHNAIKTERQSEPIPDTDQMSEGVLKI
jgi:hypothetical protein